MRQFSLCMCGVIGLACLTLSMAHAESTALANGVVPVPADATELQIKQTAGVVRAGRKLTPKVWPGGARVAVCLSFDVDNEFHTALQDSLPAALSTGEYGATTGLARILAVLDRQRIHATFFIPAGAIALHPEMIPKIQKSGRHEIGVHGWVHEYIPMLRSAKKAGFLYDSSMMAMDQPYELLSNGQRTDVIEVPVSWALDDFAYFGLNSNGSLPDPAAVFRIFRSEFDVAYEERTLFVLTM